METENINGLFSNCSIILMFPRRWLRNSFEALKENDKVFENVGTLNDGSVGNTVKDATKTMKESDSDVEEVLR
uniref:Uncharacterized protein n=1 Tax=Tanacetum cinerariifolium TaxID=118510 RepID=A0A699L2Q8_TANCI|nr:hypothetical protein [Tanacetum cinerariifolium]